MRFFDSFARSVVALFFAIVLVSGASVAGKAAADVDDNPDIYYLPDGGILAYKLSLEYIDGAFRNCARLVRYQGSATTLTIPEKVDGFWVTGVGENSFEGCGGLTEVILPERVNRISDSAFRNCSALTKITIPDAVSFIGIDAFRGCGSLREFTFPSQLRRISPFTFMNCDRLSTLVFPANISLIGAYSFSGCSSLKKLYFEGNAPIVEYGAFDSCVQLMGVYCHAGTTGWDETFAGVPVIREKKQLTVTAMDQTFVYGADISLDQSQIIVTGEDGDLAQTDLCFQVSTTVTKGADAKTYNGAIKPSLLLGDESIYEIMYIAGKLTIEKASLTVTALDQTFEEGAAIALDPSKIVISGGMPVGAPSLTTSITSGAPAGTYSGAIVPTKGTLSEQNYNLFFVPGNLIITPRTVADIATRTVTVSGRTATVTIRVEPPTDASFYVLMDSLPMGVSCTVSDVSGGGTYLADRNAVSWVSFSLAAQTVSYRVSVPDSYADVMRLSGKVTVGTVEYLVTGDSEIRFEDIPQPEQSPKLSFVSVRGQLVLIFEGTLEESVDGETWVPSSIVSGSFIDMSTTGRRFYRAVR